jgi:hypothetical protein
MVSPYNYNVANAVGNPFEAFTQAYGQGQQIRANQMAMQKAELDMQQKRTLQAAMAAFATAKTPLEKVAVIEKFPQLAEQATATWKAMDEITRKPVYEAGLGGYSLLTGGDTAGAVRTWRTAAEAFKAGNKPDMAKQFEQLAEIAEKDPNTANTMASAFLAGADPERFKKFGEALGKKDDTAFQRDYAFIKGTFGQKAADSFANSKIDETAMVPLPGGRMYVGPRSGIAAAMGVTPAAPKSGPRVGTIEDGFRFKGGDPGKSENWEKVR